MKQINDERAWYQQYLETPFSIPKQRVARAHARRDPDDLLDCPGVNLKARDGEPANGPLLTGVLVSYSDTEVVVRSKPAGFNNNLMCVWRGSPASYVNMWKVD